MFSSDGHGYITFGWIATIIGLLLFGALGNSYTSSEYQSSYYKQRCAKIYSDSPFATAYLVPSLPQPEPSQSNEELPDQPDWCDLAAQQKMAEDTAGMHLAAWAGVMSGLAGVLLLVWTLVETRNSVAVAREIGEKQTRAYVGLSKINCGGGHPFPTYTVVIRNSGQSPAKNLRFIIGWVPEEPKGKIMEFADDDFSKIDIEAGGKIKITRDLNGLVGASRKNFFEGHFPLWVNGMIRYDDVFDREPRYTWFQFKLQGSTVDGESRITSRADRENNQST